MLSDSCFARVVYTLRVADAHCFQEARLTRSTYRPTYHAKRRSAKLGLSVDTDKAAKLPVKHVSTKPYPLVIQTYSPVIESTTTCVHTIRVNGPTANDLLVLNAALAEYIARVDRSIVDDDRLMYPSTAYEDERSVGWRSEPDVPLDIISLRSSSNRSSTTSMSSDLLSTPDDRVYQPRVQYKRKSAEVVDNIPFVDKRPKYGRTSWTDAFRGKEVHI